MGLVPVTSSPYSTSLGFAVLHPLDVSEPSHAPLAAQTKHALGARSLQDVLVRSVILPCYAQDPSETTKMERVEAALLVGVRHPNLTAVQQRAKHASLVHFIFVDVDNMAFPQTL